MTPHHQIHQSLSDITNLHETTAHFPINWTFCLSFWVIRSTVHQADGNMNSANTSTSHSQFAYLLLPRPVMPLNPRVVLLSGAGGSKHTHHHHQPVPAPKLAAAGDLTLSCLPMLQYKHKIQSEHFEVPAIIQYSVGSESGGGLLVPGWAVVLVSLCVALNVGAVVWLLARRGDRRGHHLKIATADH